MNLRTLTVELIRKVDRGKIIETQLVQSALYARFPNECEQLGFTRITTKPVEEKWKKDIRFALRDAQDQRLIRHIGPPRSGKWERI